ncbi:threonine dehydratase [Malonomonas rubra DSM 5091]|uniref:L-threonine dehydratase n=1 Tax=Malonomonas rubra DSM 5091 TaxID=1122189 RepID=A0A1M6CGU5_MALRU|nr:threonine ammonia-lyase, biosynthetic [Malonomonas rubra]SHI60143.1 threonine dehydratase [Malonomonas rubra DSM 5091]
MQKLIRQILTSKVYEAAHETPLEPAIGLSRELNNNILLKREDLQPVFSFKLRGAYNKIAHLSDQEKQAGVIAASAGNHAQGVAYSARQLGLKVLIVMPATTPLIKVDAVKSLGAKVILHGDNYSEAADRCQELVAETGMTYIHPFDDELVIAGQGTVADELLRQSAGKIDAVFVPVGGGGLIAGIAAYFKALCPEVKVIGVEPYDSDAMYRSLEAGKRITLDSVGIFADGVAVRKIGKLTFDLCRQHVDEIIRVSTDELCGAIKSVYQATRSIVEPAGALATAGLKQYVQKHKINGQTLIAINSGANMNFERLRYVSERTLTGEGRESLFAVSIPEKPGALRYFCEHVLAEANITEFSYRLADRSEAQLFLGISVNSEEDRDNFSARLTGQGFRNIDLTNNELAKTHLRYMIGGRSAEATRERLFRFWFPERPGALTQFLADMGADWNISLFHYRNQGGQFGRVLIGLEIPSAEEKKLQPFLNKLGYRYEEQTDDPAYKLFL